LILGSTKNLHVDVSLDSILLESLLKHFVVIGELIIVLGIPLDLIKVEGAREDRIHNLAVNGASSTLLDLLNV